MKSSRSYDPRQSVIRVSRIKGIEDPVWGVSMVRNRVAGGIFRFRG